MVVNRMERARPVQANRGQPGRGQRLAGQVGHRGLGNLVVPVEPERGVVRGQLLQGRSVFPDGRLPPGPAPGSRPRSPRLMARSSPSPQDDGGRGRADQFGTDRGQTAQAPPDALAQFVMVQVVALPLGLVLGVGDEDRRNIQRPVFRDAPWRRPWPRGCPSPGCRTPRSCTT